MSGKIETGTGEADKRPSLQWLALRAGFNVKARQMMLFAEKVRQHSDLHVAFLVRTLWRDLEYCYDLDANVKLAMRDDNSEAAHVAADAYNDGRDSVMRKVGQLMLHIEEVDKRLGH